MLDIQSVYILVKAYDCKCISSTLCVKVVLTRIKFTTRIYYTVCDVYFLHSTTATSISALTAYYADNNSTVIRLGLQHRSFRELALYRLAILCALCFLGISAA